MRLLVFGGRAYRNRAHVFASLDLVHVREEVTWLIHGTVGDVDTETGQLIGADTLGEAWAKERGIQTFAFPPNWTLGRRAVEECNARMIAHGLPDRAVAFPGGRETDDMLDKCRRAKIPVWRVPEPTLRVRVLRNGVSVGGVVLENEVVIRASEELRNLVGLHQSKLRAKMEEAGMSGRLMRTESTSPAWVNA